MRGLWSIGVVTLAIAVAAGGCDDKKAADPPAKTEGGDKKAEGETAKKPMLPKKKELSPPPEDLYKGKARVLNLYVEPDGTTSKIEVWAKRSFKYGPVQLAKDIELGQASDWFGIPEGMSITIIKAGDKWDDRKASLGGIFAPKDGEYITGIVRHDGKRGSVGSNWEVRNKEDKFVPKAPPEGKALVMVRAYQLNAFRESLTKAGLSDSFYVGTGKAETCLRQRAEDEGKQPAILGGTNPTHHIVDPGKIKLTFHKWPSSDKCNTDPIAEFEVDAKAGEGVMLALYTKDGKSLSAVPVPLAPLNAK